ncbi:MAG: PAS domain-containing sensor histidine kinase [Pseudohongiellaceae bacterium]
MSESTPLQPGQINNVSTVYNIYRILLPLVLLITYLSDPAATLLGDVDPTLFQQSSIAYLGFGVIIMTTANRFMSVLHFLTGTLIIDIIATTVIVYSCGGIDSGLGLLLIVTIASGSILIRGRISTFLAAVATLSLIYSEVYLALSVENAPNQFIQTGMLGAMLFATSLYIQTVTNRIYKTALLADAQAQNIIDLEKLNNEIIQRMRTGVVVVNPAHGIVSMNSAAKTTLAPILGNQQTPSDELTKLPDAIEAQLDLWKSNPKRQPQPIRIPNSNKQVQLNFAFLRPELESDVLVFMEDNRQIVQRVRQMKLASLGRLSASIAHEVRNPLGAISHAGQLLKESETVSSEDERMIEIILEHCNRINMIIEDVLGASKQGSSSAEKFALASWLAGFIDNYTATHEGCDTIDLEIESEDVQINVITGQLEQVLNNLFDNGLRYSKQKTGRATLTIIVGADRKNDDEQPYLHVIDDGVGIDESAEALLFEPFHTTESSGTGLGLYISKELCEANQSQLSYSKTSDGKSCFSIYFSHPERSVA